MSDPFDRVLRDAASRGRSVGVCPDAAMLAAYVDDGLTPAERREVEAHAAGCTACEEHLGLLGAVSVETPAPETARSWFPKWAWLVPAATAVIVAAVWVRLPEQPVPGSRPAGASADASAGAEAPAAPVAGTEVPAYVTPAEAKLKSDVAVAQKPTAIGNTARAAKRSAEFGAAASSAPAAAPPPPPRPAPAAPAAVAQDAVKEELFEARALEDARAKDAEGGQRAARQESALAKSRDDAAGSATVIVVSASETESFRAIGNRIERSTNGGVTWQLVSTTPAGVFTTASCASGVCWFGTSDGRIERRVRGGFAGSVLPVRERVDAIVPATATSAVVTLTGGRKFRTTDSGATWVPVP